MGKVPSDGNVGVSRDELYEKFRGSAFHIASSFLNDHQYLQAMYDVDDLINEIFMYLLKYSFPDTGGTLLLDKRVNHKFVPKRHTLKPIEYLKQGAMSCLVNLEVRSLVFKRRFFTSSSVNIDSVDGEKAISDFNERCMLSSTESNFMYQELLGRVRERLSVDSVCVFDLFVEPSSDFVSFFKEKGKKLGANTTIKSISEFFNIPMSEASLLVDDVKVTTRAVCGGY